MLLIAVPNRLTEINNSMKTTLVRGDRVSGQLKDYIIQGVSLIQNMDDYSERQRIQLLETILSLGAGAAWRPKAITIGALQAYKDNDFGHVKGLERAHITPRRETLKNILYQKYPENDWWDWYIERDYTVLAKRSENRDEKNFEKLSTIPIPLNLELFQGKRVGWVFDEPEKKFLQGLARDHFKNTQGKENL